MTDPDRLLLEFEDRHPKHDGRKELAMREQLGLTTVRYYQRLHQLIRDPEVVAMFPQLVARTQRLTEQRLCARRLAA